MKQIILKQSFEFEKSRVKFDDTLQADEALIRIHRIGICGTDYHTYRGKQPFFSYPRVLGHELGAEIVKIGSNTEGVGRNFGHWRTRRTTRRNIGKRLGFGNWRGSDWFVGHSICKNIRRDGGSFRHQQSASGVCGERNGSGYFDRNVFRFFSRYTEGSLKRQFTDYRF